MNLRNFLRLVLGMLTLGTVWSAPTATITPNVTTAVVGQVVNFNVSGDCATELNEIGLELCDGSGNPVSNLGILAVGGTSASYSFPWTPSSPGTYLFDGYAWNADRSALARTSAVALTVSAASINHAPTASVRANRAVMQVGESVVISVDGHDDDGNLHYVNVDQLTPNNGFYGPGDTGTENTPNNGAYDIGGYRTDYTRNLTLTLNTPGVYTFRGAVNDDSGWYYSGNNITVTVNTAANSTPTATIAPSVTTAVVGQAVSFNVSGSCAIGLNEIGLELCDGSGNPVANLGAIGVGGNSASNAFSWTPSSPGTYLFDGYAWNTDRSALARTSTVALTVSAASINHAPTASVRANRAVMQVGESVVISVDGHDEDGNLHYVNVDQLTPNNGFYGSGDTGTENTPNNGAYDIGGYRSDYTRNLTLTLNTPGVYTFRGAVNDDSGWYYSGNNITVTVNAAVNSTPAATITPDATTVVVGQAVNFNVVGSCPAGLNEIGLELCDGNGSPVSNLGILAVGGNSASHSFAWTPSSPGTYLFDGYAWNTDRLALARTSAVTLTVNAASINHAPTANVRANRAVMQVGESVVISVDAHDEDGNLHYVNVDQLTPNNGFYGPGDIGTENTPNNGAYDIGGYRTDYTRNLTLTLNTPGVYTFRGAVNDDSGWYYSGNNITVTVNSAANSTPTATLAPSATTAVVGQSVNFNISGSCATGLNEIGLELCDGNGNPVANLGLLAVGGNSASSSFAWTPSSPGTYLFDGYAWNADRSVLTRTSSITLLVNGSGPNHAPFGYFDGSTDSIPSGGTISGSGWAADYEMGAPVDHVDIMIDGHYVGRAVLGGQRQDVQNANVTRGGWSPRDITSAGWSFSYAIGSLAAGAHTIETIAWDSQGASASLGSKPLTVTQGSGNPITDSDYDLHYEYNNRNQVTAIKTPDGNSVANFTYQADGKRTSKWLSNDTRTDYGYDGAGRLTSNHNYRANDGSWIEKQEYGYDLRDRRVWTQRNGDRGDTYTYQPDSELTDYKFNASDPRGTPSGWNKQTSFAYDEVGNRTSVNDGGNVVSYDVDHANQYRSITGANIQYGDGKGNVTQWKDWIYTYDAENRMLTANKPGVSITFVYDPAGRLVQRTTNGQTEYITYDGVEQIIRHDGSDALVDQVVWGPSRDEILTDFAPARGTRYYHSDVQGNVIAVTDTGRNVLEYSLYDPYGGVSFYDSNWSSRADSAIGGRFLFNGQERMASLDGFYNYKNRFYSPELGRFLQSDPARLAATDLNLYRYCRNDPLNGTDPDGRFLITLGFAIWDTVQMATGGISKTEYALRMGINGAALAVDMVSGVGGDGALLMERMAAQGAIKVGVASLRAAKAVELTDAVVAGGHLVMDATKNGQTGSYTTYHESGKKYHGKGPRERSEVSGAEKAAEHDDPHVATDWKPAVSEEEAFKDEAQRIREDAGVTNPNNYNKINSPGERLLQQEEMRAQEQPAVGPFDKK